MLSKLIKSTVFIVFFFSFFLIYDVSAGSAPVVKVKEEFFTMNGREVYLAYSTDNGIPKKALMAIHGSGREARSYRPNDKKSVPFYIHQRDLAVNNGFIFVVVSNGKDTWGTEKGLQTVLDVHEYVHNRFKTDKQFVLWATSAGGTLANKMVQQHPDKVSKVLGTFPVYDIKDSYTRLESARKAWGSFANVRGKNPLSHPSLLTKKPYLIYHGRADKAVPYKEHSMRLYKEVNKLGGNVTLHIVNGGHTTTNWNVYNDQEITTFLNK